MADTKNPTSDTTRGVHRGYTTPFLVDFDLLQEQKRALMRAEARLEETDDSLKSANDDVLLAGLHEMIDCILDDAQERGLWDYETWQREHGKATDA